MSHLGFLADFSNALAIEREDLFLQAGEAALADSHDQDSLPGRCSAMLQSALSRPNWHGGSATQQKRNVCTEEIIGLKKVRYCDEMNN